MSGVVGTLTQRLGRSPSPKEIADETGLTEEDVLEALEADGAYGTTQLEPPSDSGYRPDTSSRLADAPEDRTEQVVERRLLAASLVGKLSEREREIVEMRFVDGLTQSQIADRIGVSQMQVSRLLTRALATMRAHAENDDA
jgi:RNA polymerase sigma-B factor